MIGVSDFLPAVTVSARPNAINQLFARLLKKRTSDPINKVCTVDGVNYNSGRQANTFHEGDTNT